MSLTPTERRGQIVGLYGLAMWTGLAVGPVLGEVVFRSGSFGAVWVTAAVLPAVSVGVLSFLPNSAHLGTAVSARLLPPSSGLPEQHRQARSRSQQIAHESHGGPTEADQARPAALGDRPGGEVDHVRSRSEGHAQLDQCHSSDCGQSDHRSTSWSFVGYPVPGVNEKAAPASPTAGYGLATSGTASGRSRRPG